MTLKFSSETLFGVEVRKDNCNPKVHSLKQNRTNEIHYSRLTEPLNGNRRYTVLSVRSMNVTTTDNRQSDN